MPYPWLFITVDTSFFSNLLRVVLYWYRSKSYFNSLTRVLSFPIYFFSSMFYILIFLISLVCYIQYFSSFLLIYTYFYSYYSNYFVNFYLSYSFAFKFCIYSRYWSMTLIFCFLALYFELFSEADSPNT